ncbi:MAG: protealysin inhibitor emfourin [Mycobacterium sp.]
MVEYLIERRGGFAGLKAKGTVTDQTLDADSRGALDALLDGPGPLPSDPGADRYVYTVTRISGSDRTTRDIPESLMPAAAAHAVKEEI